MSSRLLALTVLLALALAACGADEPATAPDTEADATAEATEDPTEDAAAEDPTDPADATDDDATEDPTEDAADPAAVTVATASTELGDVLVDGEGATLYLFDNDGGGPDSTCYDDCAANWPPLTVDGEPAADGGADASLLGTTERDDGTVQVTYAGHPLYYFAGDSAPGDTAGQGVGDIWWVVDASGEAVHDAEAAAGGSGGGMGGSDY